MKKLYIVGSVVAILLCALSMYFGWGEGRMARSIGASFMILVIQWTFFKAGFNKQRLVGAGMNLSVDRRMWLVGIVLALAIAMLGIVGLMDYLDTGRISQFFTIGAMIVLAFEAMVSSRLLRQA